MYMYTISRTPDVDQRECSMLKCGCGVSLSAVGWAETELSLDLVGFAASSGTVVTLEAQGFAEVSMFTTKTQSVVSHLAISTNT